MTGLEELFERNSVWARETEREDPGFFRRLSGLQSPEYLWIGCADSRVPATTIVDLPPGAIFVHRNIANIVAHADINCLSVLQFAVEILKVKHIIVCGHYGCGGIAAAMTTREYGLIDNWLRNIKDVNIRYQEELDAIEDSTMRAKRLCELNVITQATNAATTTIVQNAWRRGQSLAVHGVVYSLENGILEDLGIHISSSRELPPVYRLQANNGNDRP
jgi:carbonic anhydrase